MSDQTATTPAVRRQGAASSDGNRTPQQIEDDLVATRARLAATVDSLVDRVHPKAVAARGVAKVKAAVVDTDGQPRTDRIVKLAVVAGSVVAALVLLRRAVRGGR